VGNAAYISALKQLKSNTDYGIFLPVQKAGICALRSDECVVRDTAAAYEKRRDILIGAFASHGWQIDKPHATMFVWAKIPESFGSYDVAFVQQLMQATGVLVVPGSAFGRNGAGYVRIALVQNEDRILTAAERIGEFLRG
jgi:LL-diaminopimelate aminotransferase